MSSSGGSGVDLLSSQVRRRIVDTLANLPSTPDGSGGLRPAEGLSAQDLAEHLGLHVTTVRFHLDQLVSGGLLTSHFEPPVGAGRPRKLYAVEPGSLETVSTEDSYRMLSGLLVESFRTQPDGRQLSPEEVGVRWSHDRVAEEDLDPADQAPARTAGQWLGKVGHMVDLLREWGYVPEVSTTDGGRTANVSLHDCPFLSLARDNVAVVCGIHRGLIRGVMQSLGEESTTVGLTPLVGPNLCVAALTSSTPFTSHRARNASPDKETRP
ncbi:MAG TPA: helix-turn-helix domain-containing protein [Intrasporangium sp.]|uniref:helix-turn-helix transcriptional regulator n=1 Tax=Intrasporangium sp. TaxID=1925024 RepID=UPI002D7A2EAF|nr:helix-turn-helix domain-containing protein [Intrasporangium sp.]HET7397663.1 helix-turn-helix domain-containing protein [Intrasporangium sp.]